MIIYAIWWSYQTITINHNKSEIMRKTKYWEMWDSNIWVFYLIDKALMPSDASISLFLLFLCWMWFPFALNVHIDLFMFLNWSYPWLTSISFLFFIYIYHPSVFKSAFFGDFLSFMVKKVHYTVYPGEYWQESSF